jgi:hypothetical protein
MNQTLNQNGLKYFSTTFYCQKSLTPVALLLSDKTNLPISIVCLGKAHQSRGDATVLAIGQLRSMSGMMAMQKPFGYAPRRLGAWSHWAVNGLDRGGVVVTVAGLIHNIGRGRPHECLLVEFGRGARRWEWEATDYLGIRKF